MFQISFKINHGAGVGGSLSEKLFGHILLVQTRLVMDYYDEINCFRASWTVLVQNRTKNFHHFTMKKNSKPNYNRAKIIESRENRPRDISVHNRQKITTGPCRSLILG